MPPKGGLVKSLMWDYNCRDMTMLNYVLDQLDLHKGQLPQIAKDCGIPYRTLQKISLRLTNNPRLETIEPLYEYLKEKEHHTAVT